MHRSVLTNKKYIKFAEANTVEMLSMGNLAKGRGAGDKRAETFTAKDGKEYLVGWPNLTPEEFEKSQAPRKYKEGNGIPETAIVNPHSGEKMDSKLGVWAMGKLVDAVTAAKKQLTKDYGKGVTRKDLKKVNKEAAKTRSMLEKGEIVKALKAAQAQWKKLAKKPKVLQDIVAKLLDECFADAEKQLDELEAVIGRGEKKSAARTLGPLARALKGSRLEKRVNELVASTKTE